MSYCWWGQNSDGLWTADCGHSFEFNDGTPRDNSAKFCMFCGKKLRFTSYRDPSHRVRKPRRGPLTDCDMK